MLKPQAGLFTMSIKKFALWGIFAMLALLLVGGTIAAYQVNTIR